MHAGDRDEPRSGTPGDEPEAGGESAEPEPHVVPIEDALDLHSFAPRDIPDVVRDYLEQAQALGLAEVRLIHGRGTGFQRERVREVLATHPAVERFADAPPGRGHWGATVVRLLPESPSVP